MTDAVSIYESGEYAARNPGWHSEHSEWKASQIIKMLQRSALSPRRICEIGCGAGAILEHLQKQLPPEAEFFGYDISPQAIAIANSRENGRLRFSEGWPVGRSFDLVLAIDVFEHVEDYLGFIRRACALAPAQIFHIPLDLSLLSLLRPVLLHWAREHVGHLHYFTDQTACATLNTAGCEVIDTFFTNVELDLNTHSHKMAQRMRRWLRRWRPDLAARLLGGFSLMALSRAELKAPTR